MNGVSGADMATQFDASKFKTKFACEIKGFDATNFMDRKEARKLDRFSQIALVASDQAVIDAGITKENVDHDRVGVIFASGIGGLTTFTEEVTNFVHGDGTPRFNPFFIPKIILDIAAGTGSSSRPLVDKGAEVTALDFSQGMIEQGRKQNKNINFVQGDALKLPFEDNSFEVTTISFGLRNTSSTEIALKEALRVTKDGGRIVVAEFSHPVNPIFKKIYLNYLMKALPVIVKKISKNPDAYIYLAESIRAWPDQAELASIMRDSGFKSVAWQDLTFGIVAVHIGYKA